MSEIMLSVDSLTVKYGEMTAVDNVSMIIHKGEMVSVLGPNSSGKTTLMNTIAGLNSPCGGEISLEGRSLNGLSSDKIVELGVSLVPQGGRCFSRMSVFDNLMVGSYSKRSRRSAKSSLDRVYELFPVLYEKRSQPAGSLSGGQRQMVAIGRALMSCPRLLLFDELSLGLAPVVIKDIYSAIKHISREEDTAIVMVEQDTKRAMKMTDRTYIMLKGNVVLEGRPAELSDDAVKKAYFGS
ncbi:MAG: ABC transporter ATP-binding protein [Oscillospiraceae bacterium]|nr:ABC transporter ATP-binding protein [Oscillospiraceae bacterium]